MPRRHRAIVVSAVVLSVLACGTGEVDPDGNPAQDVRGTYDLTWSESIALQLDVGGATYEATAEGWDDVVELGTHEGEPLVLDLGAYCSQPDIVCPSEAFPARVTVDQLEHDVVRDLHTIRIHDLDAASEDTGAVAPYIEGLVDHAQADRFLAGLEGRGDSEGDCGTLALSYAAGRFARSDAPDPGTGVAPVVGITEGEVVAGWLGLCAFEGLALGATLTATVTYEGARTGDL